MSFLLLFLGPAAYGLRDLLGSAPKYSLYARRSAKDKFKVRLVESFFYWESLDKIFIRTVKEIFLISMYYKYWAELY